MKITQEEVVDRQTVLNIELEEDDDFFLGRIGVGPSRSAFLRISSISVRYCSGLCCSGIVLHQTIAAKTDVVDSKYIPGHIIAVST